jgi:lipoprotein signal peptidase
VADAAICVGVGLLLLDSLRSKRTAEAPAASPPLSQSPNP